MKKKERMAILKLLEHMKEGCCDSACGRTCIFDGLGLCGDVVPENHDMKKIARFLKKLEL